jgi:acylphosphatase
VRDHERGGNAGDSGESEERATFRAVVRGRVQGVNFRQFVYTRARFLRLGGYVSNLDDGQSVEVVAEGPRGDLDQLLEYLREGPRSAQIEDVEVEWGEATNRWTDFGVMS